jgi:hypothetical protein
MKNQSSQKKVFGILALALLLAAVPAIVYFALKRQAEPALPPAVAAKTTKDVKVARSEPKIEPTIMPAPATSKPRKQKPPIEDPKAREALRLVGADMAATEYWVTAINNPKLGREERKDLIEDLNEDGFTDKKRPSLDDLPLIETRIALIEMLAPSAMDEVNTDAFQEAYKDLTKMRSRLTGQPETTRNLRPR